MEHIENAIGELIKKYSTAPYLFIGSGFSRRYLGLEDWQGLLQRFCADLKPYEYYRSTYNNDLPAVAGAMSRDYNQVVWSSADPVMQAFVTKHSPKLLNSSSALKIAISEYLMKPGMVDVDAAYTDEIEALKKVSVEGIITTNWDNLLSELFPSLHPVVGQDELVSSSTLGVGEIFKIHGCSTQPESLVLTDEDYHDFNRRNAYLAAKLVTYFVEHPVIFLGYSLTDENVTEILSSIINCLGRDKVRELDDNFIFVQRAARGQEKISRSFKNIGGAYIPIIILELADFGMLYRPLSQIKRKLPMKLMRYFKEQIYEFVHSNDPKGKIAVIDWKDLDDSTELGSLEIVIGVGLMQKLGQIGYHTLKPAEIIEEFLFEKHDNIDIQQLIESTFADLKEGYLPIHKFINSVPGMDTTDLPKVAKTNFERTRSGFHSSAYKRQFDINYTSSTLEELFEIEDIKKALYMIPFYDFKTSEDIDKLGVFLKEKFPVIFPENEDEMDKAATTPYRKAVALYDFLKHKPAKKTQRAEEAHEEQAAVAVDAITTVTPDLPDDIN